MVDLSKNVIDLAISTIKKTHHGVTIATVPEEIKANLEVRVNNKIPFKDKISSYRLKDKVRLS